MSITRSMKIRLALIQLLFVISIAFSTRANAQTNSQDSVNAVTNTFSLDRNDVRDFAGYEEAHYLRHLVHGEVMSELLPASQDTNGNWGPVTNGLQLSLRFMRHDKLFIGSVMPATTVLRNLEPYIQTLLLTNSLSLYISFLVRDTNGYVPERKYEVHYPANGTMPIPALPHGLENWIFKARSEKILEVDLNHLFDLSQPGEYSVQAICRVYSPDTKVPIYEVSSGTISFQIFNKPTPP